MLIIKTPKLASKFNINKILSLPKKEFAKQISTVTRWLNENYKLFQITTIGSPNHKGETLLNHVVNTLLNVDTDGLNEIQIHTIRVALIHHDIDHVEKKQKGKKSENALKIWRNHLSKELTLTTEQDSDVNFYIKHHDAMGYFFIKFLKKELEKGISSDKIWEKWIERYPQANNKEFLSMILRINSADVLSAGGLLSDTRNKFVSNIKNVYDNLSRSIPDQPI